MSYPIKKKYSRVATLVFMGLSIFSVAHWWPVSEGPMTPADTYALTGEVVDPPGSGCGGNLGCTNTDVPRTAALTQADLTNSEKPWVGGKWAPKFNWPLVPVSLANLPDGRILGWSGGHRTQWDGARRNYNAIWDPKTGTIESVLSQGHNMFCAGTAMLTDGRIMTSGGQQGRNAPEASLFDWRNDQWDQVQSMHAGRWYPTMVAFPDNSVYSATGISSHPGTSELWRESSGWAFKSGINWPSIVSGAKDNWTQNIQWPFLHLAPNGRLIHTAPSPNLSWIDVSGTGSSQFAGQVPTNEEHFNGASVNYDVGKVITTGGNRGVNGSQGPGYSQRGFVVNVNGATPVVQRISDMNYRRSFHNPVLLPTGEVAMIGGASEKGGGTDEGAVYNSEIWNPETDTWRLTARMNVARGYHSTALLMTDGRVISAGGGYVGAGTGNHLDAQVWSPAYLFNDDGSDAVRPVIEQAPEVAPVGASFEVRTDSDVAYFSIIRMSSTTHQMKSDARFLKLEPVSSVDSVHRLQLSGNKNVVMPGYWMLFAVNQQGVPSEAHVLRIELASTSPNVSNIARQGVATQVSNVQANSTADKAIDGVTNGNWSQNIMAHTNTAARPWWQLDLRDTARIDKIKLFNRTDCCSARLANFYVLISDTPMTGRSLPSLLADDNIWNYHVSSAVGAQIEIPVNGQSGRYVRVQRNESGYLTLAEVQVLGIKGEAVDSADSIAVSTANKNSWKSVQFSQSTTGIPAVILGPPTLNQGQGVNTRIKDLNENGFALQLDEWDHLDGVHGTERVGLFRLSQGVHDLGGLAAEAQVVRADDTWKRIDFSAPFSSAPVILTQTASALGAESVAVRVRSISTTGAEIRLQEQKSNQRSHATELVSIIAVNPGEGRFNGMNLVAGQQMIDGSPATINYGKRLEQPVVLASVNTVSNPDPVNVRLVSQGKTSAVLRLREDVSTGASNIFENRIGWLAIDREAVPLSISSVEDSPSEAGSAARFEVGVSGGGSVSYSWDFGDGSVSDSSTNNAILHNYSSAGRYLVTVTVRDQAGNVETHTFSHLVHYPLLSAGAGKSSSTIAVTGDKVWNVNPDNDSVGVSRGSQLLSEIAVGQSPWAIAATPDGSKLWVVNKASASISIIDTNSMTVQNTINLPRGSQPHGVVLHPNGNRAYVSLEATGQLLELNSSGATVSTQDVGSRPRHLAISSDGSTLYVSRYITDPVAGEDTLQPVVDHTGGANSATVLSLQTANLTSRETVSIRYSDRQISEHSGPGLPNYLGAVALSPDGRFGYVPSKQDRILAGTHRPDSALTHDQSVRAISSLINLQSNAEDFSHRIDHDNASLASAAVYGPLGAYLFTALEGNREVAISDAYTGGELARFDVGHAPQGLAMSDDGNILYVHNFLDRSVSAHDISRLHEGANLIDVPQLSTVSTVGSEELSVQVLRGKQFFYDSRDSRLASQTYMSCGSCHNDGDHDGRTWDFSQFGEGLRNTTSLRGKGAAVHGMLHWSSNFDEFHDFEGQIRSFSLGTGLMSNADFSATQDSLGETKSGRSSDLDALAAYMQSLMDMPTNPLAGDSLSEAASRGRVLFQGNSCSSCHSGAAMTDSATAQRHDVGTINTASGERLGGNLDGLDTPTLLNLHETGPYLHNGSAVRVRDAVSAHEGSNFSATQLADIEAYLLELPAAGDTGGAGTGAGTGTGTTDTQLAEGTALSASVGQGQQHFYAFHAEEGVTEIHFTLSGLNADADLYVRAGQRPSGDITNGGEFDGSSTNGGNSREFVAMANSAATDWYVGIDGYQASDYSLLVNVVRRDTGTGGGAGAEATRLQPDVASSGSIAEGTWKYFVITATAATESVEVELSGLSDDVDLYVRRGAKPTGHIDEGGIYDCGSTSGGSSTERCSSNNSSENEWFIGVYGYRASSFSLKTTLVETDTGTGTGTDNQTLTVSQAETGSLAASQWHYYEFEAPSNAVGMVFTLGGLSADADLYVRRDTRPSGAVDTGGQYDCGSYAGSSSAERCEMSNAGGAKYVIGIYGYQATAYQLSAVVNTSDVVVTPVANGQPLSGQVGVSAWRYYRFTSSTSNAQVQVVLGGLTADADLYVRESERPAGDPSTGANADCSSLKGSTDKETCVLANSGVTEWFVGVYGYQASDYTLSVQGLESRSLNVSKGPSLGKGDTLKAPAVMPSGSGASSGAVKTSGGGGSAGVGFLLLMLAAAGRLLPSRREQLIQ